MHRWTRKAHHGAMTLLAMFVIFHPVNAFAAPLNSDEQAILVHLEERQPEFSIEVRASNTSTLKREMEEAENSDPYLAMDISSASLILSTGILNHATFYVSYRESAAQYAAVLSGVKQVLKTIIKPGMDVFAKEKAIHDFVVLHTAYDSTLQNYTAYDALYKQSATCQGYAMLTYQLLKAAGIPNLLISGTATNSLGSAPHAWNEVDLDGKWYQLDTTWDDPIPNVPGRVLYNYFNLTSAQMARTHSWSKAGLPIANTDYVSLLENSKNPQDRAILNDTGLFVEEPQNTYTNMNRLQTALSRLDPSHTYSFRIPYVDTPILSSLRLPYVSYFSYQRDTREPNYAIVTMTMNARGCGNRASSPPFR